MRNDVVLPPRNGLSLCAGAGGLDMGLMLAEPDFHTRCFVEWEEYPRDALIAAQRAGYFAPAPIWDDVTTFDAKPLAGAIDTILAGYPCQPFSQAGQRKGEDDERHLWPDIERIVGELGDGLRWCFFENVAGHLTLGLETVGRALHGLGFRVAAGVFSAGEVGAPHERQRVFIVAYRESVVGRSQQPEGSAWSGRAGPSGDSREMVHAGRPERRSGDAKGHEHDGPERGRDQGPSGSRQSGATLDDPAGTRCQPEGQRSGSDSQGGECVPGAGCNDLADASGDSRGVHPGPRREGIGTADAGGRGDELADASAPGLSERGSLGRFSRSPLVALQGQTALGTCPYFFPPGPGDRDAWSSVLAMAPDLAPAVAFGDIARRADQLAAMVAAGQLAEAEAEPDLRGMVDGLAQRSRALRLLGNGVVPLAAAYAWRTLSAAHGLGWVDLGADRGNDAA